MININAYRYHDIANTMIVTTLFSRAFFIFFVRYFLCFIFAVGANFSQFQE